MAGGTKTSLWPPRAIQAGRMMRREVACGTALAPREAARLGGREATGAGDRAMLQRSPATRWDTVNFDFYAPYIIYYLLIGSIF